MSHFDGKIFLSPDVETNHHFTKQVRNGINIVGHIKKKRKKRRKKRKYPIRIQRHVWKGAKKVLLIYDGMVCWVSVESGDFAFACV